MLGALWLTEVEEDSSGLLCVCLSGLTLCVTRTLHNNMACSMTTLPLSVTDSLLLQLTKFLSVSLHVLRPDVISPIALSLIIPPHFPSLSLCLSLFLSSSARHISLSPLKQQCRDSCQHFAAGPRLTELICSSDLHCAVCVCTYHLCPRVPCVDAHMPTGSS